MFSEVGVPGTDTVYHSTSYRCISWHIIYTCIYVLVGGIPTPLKNITSSLGMMTFPTGWKVIKFHGSKPTRYTMHQPISKHVSKHRYWEHGHGHVSKCSFQVIGDRHSPRLWHSNCHSMVILGGEKRDSQWTWILIIPDILGKPWVNGSFDVRINKCWLTIVTSFIHFHYISPLYSHWKN